MLAAGRVEITCPSYMPFKSQDLKISRLFIWENVRKLEISGDNLELFFALWSETKSQRFFFLKILSLNLLSHPVHVSPHSTGYLSSLFSIFYRP